MAAKNFREHHARQDDVVGKLRLAGALGARIDFAKWFADYALYYCLVAFRYLELVRHQVSGSYPPT